METLEKTKNYDAFKHLNGNRPVDENYVIRLMESFKRKFIPPIIMVNGRGQIIDGQHRLEAVKRLGLWFYVQRVNGYGLEEVQALNSVKNIWGKKHYLESYCELGCEPYLRFREFMQNNKDFGIACASYILSNDPNNWTPKKKVNNVSVIRTRPFEDGKFVIKDLALAYENVGKIREYSKFYSGYNRRSFVRVMIGLFKNPKFNHPKMIHKLSLQPNALVHCATVEQYRLLIEEIYNYKNSEKVNLRYIQ